MASFNNQHIQLAYLLICILATLFSVSSGQGFGSRAAITCQGGYPVGATIRTDAYWYECGYGGKLIPKGCITDTGRQINIGATAPSNNGDYESRCDQDASGFLKMKPTACIVNGMRVQAGTEYDVNGVYWVRCEDKGYYVMRETMGCVVDGRRVAMGEKATRGQTVYECQPGQNRDAVLSALGCTIDGREHPIGRMFDDSKFFYHCSLGADNTCSAKMIGCIHRNDRYSDRQIYKEGEEIFRCIIDPFAARGEHKLAGCTKQDPFTGEHIEKTFGCQWEDGTAPTQYMVECVERDGKAIKQRLRCKYTASNGAVANLLNGCYTEVGGQFVGCASDRSGQLEIKVFPTSQEYLATQYGLVNDPYQCSIFSRLTKRSRR